MALHRSSKFNAADGLFETEKPIAPAFEKKQKAEKKPEQPKAEEKPEESSRLIEETTQIPPQEPFRSKDLSPDYIVKISSSQTDKLNEESSYAPVSPSEIQAEEAEDLEPAEIQIPRAEAPQKSMPAKKPQKKLSATAIMPRKVPKKASESVINKTYTIDQGTYDLMNALVRFLRDSKVKDEETGYLINESAFIRRAIRTEMDRVFDSNDEEFSDSVRQYLAKPLKSSPAKITY